MADQPRQLNALQQLIQDWLDAELGRSVGDLARKVHGNRNTFYALMERDRPAAMPNEDTMRKLSRGLELPFRTVVEAAVSATYNLERVATEANPRLQAIIAHAEDQPAEVQEHILRIIRTFEQDTDG